MTAKLLSFKRAFVVLFGLLGSFSACSSETRPPPLAVGGASTGDVPLPTSCSTPNQGCACPSEGEAVDCGSVKAKFGDYVTCSSGTRTCLGGKWGECRGEREVQRQLADSDGGGNGSTLSSLGVSAVCPPGFDPCDPYCNKIEDTPDATLGPPTGFRLTPTGLSLEATGVGGCTTLTLTPTPATVSAGNTVTITAFTASTLTATPTGPVTFSLTASPPGCVASPFSTTWTTSRPDRALITGANNTNGSLAIALPVAGVIRVTAYAQGLSASVDITLKVNFLDRPTGAAAASPNVVATASQRSAFGDWNTPAAGTVAAGVNWLYPYANTYFPLGLPAPSIQYWYTSTGGSGTSAALGDRAVKVSLRYPTNRSSNPASMTYSDFNYSLVVRESNTIAQSAGVGVDSRDPQVTIPQHAWSYFEQTARGNDADLVIQRVRAGVVEQETRRTIRLVDGQLKGTIYYNSYSSPQGANTGAVLSIAPGATSPTLAVQPSGRCTVCHSINKGGTHLITNTADGATVGPINQARRYVLNTTTPSPTVANSYPGLDGPIPDPGDTSTVVRTGAGPNVTISGTPAIDGMGMITVTTGGTRGTARFSWNYDAQWGTGVLTAASVALVSTGMTANFANGTYVVGTIYEWSGAQSSGSSFGQYFANRLGDRYTFGGAWGDGTLYMTHGGRPVGNVGVGDPNFRAPADYSNLYSVSNPATPIAVSNWPSNMLAVTPRFSVDGTNLTFGFWGGDPLPTSSGTLTSNPAGSRLAVADFTVTCTTPPCTSSSPGLNASVSNVRDLTPGVTQRVAWPSFTPSGNAVVYQRQYRTSKSRTEMDVLRTGSGPSVTITGSATTVNGLGLITVTTAGSRGTARFSWSLGTASGTNVLTSATVALGTTGLTANFQSGTYAVSTTYSWDVGVLSGPGWGQWTGWSPSHVNSSAGALAELWLSNVPDNSSTAATPTRLLALNGLNPDASSYLPEDTRPVSPPSTAYHRNTGTSFGITQADLCSNTGTATAVYDHRLNYLPAFNPTESGGFAWVVFTSRRMYGNVAYDNPWDGKPGISCNSDTPPTKKLWVAAIDSTITPGTDPSHPAFYLPGQELGAGNSNGDWVNSPCLAINAACSSNDDCCGATGSTPTTACRVISAATVPPTRQCRTLASCSPPGAACTTTSDCCTGLCPTGGGVCLVVPPPIYLPQVYQREYVATCPAGTQVKWRHFEWQSTIPAGTSIAFAVQSKATAAASYLPGGPLALTSATTTTAAGVWNHGPTTVDDILVAGGVGSRPYLLVRMTFTPNMGGVAAPTLANWRQIYDCVPAE